jgi:hypothetical protein
MSHLPVLHRPDPNFAEVIDKYTVVSAYDDFVVVTPKDPVRPNHTGIQLADPTVMDMRELGAAGGTMYQHYLLDDYNPELRGRAGLLQYDRMRKSDATVRKALRLVKTPVLGARWYVEPATDGPRDRRIADFVWKNLTERMTITWWQVLYEALGMMDFGHYIFEKVYEFGPDGRVQLRKLAPRHPIDALEWHWDDNGGPVGVTFSRPMPRDSRASSQEIVDQVFIPIEKLVVFTFDKEANNMMGTSVLRSAYKHWFFKEQLYKIDAIQKERHGIGIPVIKLPPGFSADDAKKAHEIGRNLRTNEKAHVVLPPNWDLIFAKIEGQSVNALESAVHHDEMIMGNVLGDFLNMEQRGATAIEAQWEIFQKGTAFVAEIVKDSFNKWVIPELVDFNWRVTDYPELRVRRIGETTDWRTFSFALRNFVGANILRPDEELEKWIREEMDLPHVDEDTRREVVTPQAGGARVGPPRQGLPRADTGTANAGRDGSGG